MKRYGLLIGVLCCGLALFTGCGQQGDEVKQPDNSGDIRAELNPVVRDVTKPIGTYTNALTFLYNQDEALNDGIEMVAFDFSKCDNLTDEEKTALMQYLANEWGVSCSESNFEQLKADGLIIVEENGFARFEKGLLVTVETDGTLEGAEKKEDFVFSVGKYRSSLGAYWLSDCKAIFNGKEWSYTIGAHMIS